MPNSSMQSNESDTAASYKCHHSGSTAPPLQSQYMLNSHVDTHSQARPHFCPVEGCPRSVGGKGFKRKNEMIRHGLVHNSPGYVCPFCPEQQRKYPRVDNLQRHVRVHHIDKGKDDPALRAVLALRPERISRRRRPRVSAKLSPEPGNVQQRDESKDMPVFCEMDTPRSVGVTGLGPLRSSSVNKCDALLARWTRLRADEIVSPFVPQPC